MGFEIGAREQGSIGVLHAALGETPEKCDEVEQVFGNFWPRVVARGGWQQPRHSVVARLPEVEKRTKAGFEVPVAGLIPAPEEILRAQVGR